MDETTPIAACFQAHAGIPCNIPLLESCQKKRKNTSSSTVGPPAA
jgi:hypothetical protein